MSIGTILLILLVLALVGVIPVWPHARSWGYGPSGLVGVVIDTKGALLVADDVGNTVWRVTSAVPAN